MTFISFIFNFLLPSTIYISIPIYMFIYHVSGSPLKYTQSAIREHFPWDLNNAFALLGHKHKVPREVKNEGYYCHPINNYYCSVS